MSWLTESWDKMTSKKAAEKAAALQQAQLVAQKATALELLEAQKKAALEIAEKSAPALSDQPYKSNGAATNYLEGQISQLIKNQQTLSTMIKNSGIVSKEQAREMAITTQEKQTEAWLPIILILIILVGFKLWK